MTVWRAAKSENKQNYEQVLPDTLGSDLISQKVPSHIDRLAVRGQLVKAALKEGS
jgi:hypothetical protein